MYKIHLDLPTIEFKKLDFTLMNNVEDLGRNNSFENQNRTFRAAGFSKSNTQYYQTFNLGDECIEFAKSLFDKFSVSVIKQMPGQTIPLHTDTFFTFSLNNGIKAEDCIRVNIFLEDWKNGHYFEIDNLPMLQWSAGDAIVMNSSQPHLSGNMGMKPKFTMQITGNKNEFKRG